MPWLRIQFKANACAAEPCTDTLEACGAISVTLQDAGDDPVFETYWERSPLWPQLRFSALFPEHADTDQIMIRVRATLGLSFTPLHEIDLLGDEDWAHSWMAHYKPLKVGRNLWVVPSWCAPPQPGAVNIILDPGLAFGTGDHPTTALCLEWLSEQALAGKTILDYGCGSGILSIAALKLGARAAVAVDIDPQALEVARQNALHNGIHTNLDVLLPTALASSFQADIVIANILFGALIELAPEITARVRPGGLLGLSGLLGKDQAAELRPHYEPAFYFSQRERQNWMLLASV